MRGIDGTRKLLGLTARALALLLVVLLANLVTVYIVAGVAFQGDWERVDKAISRAYDEFFDN